MNPDLTDTRQQESMKQVKPYDEATESAGEDSESEKPARRSGRRKIKIEYIEDKNRRHITFSKRKAGIMKKAYELSTLTGTQVLLLVVSETGLVYTFTTVKLQPIVTKPEGKNLIQACLNAPDPMSAEAGDASYNASPQVEDKKVSYEEKKVEAPVLPPPTQQQQQQGQNQATAPPPPPQQQQQAPSTQPYNPSGGYGNQNYPSQSNNNYPSYNMAPGQNAPNGPSATGGYGQSPQQQPQQSAYGQMPQPAFYGNGQQHYMPHQQQQQQQQQQGPQGPGYWPGNAPRQDIKEEQRRNVKK